MSGRKTFIVFSHAAPSSAPGQQWDELLLQENVQRIGKSVSRYPLSELGGGYLMCHIDVDAFTSTNLVCLDAINL